MLWFVNDSRNIVGDSSTSCRLRKFDPMQACLYHKLTAELDSEALALVCLCNGLLSGHVFIRNILPVRPRRCGCLTPFPGMIRARRALPLRRRISVAGRRARRAVVVIPAPRLTGLMTMVERVAVAPTVLSCGLVPLGDDATHRPRSNIKPGTRDRKLTLRYHPLVEDIRWLAYS